MGVTWGGEGSTRLPPHRKFARPVTPIAKLRLKPARLEALPWPLRVEMVPTAMSAAARTTTFPSDSSRMDSHRSQLLSVYHAEMFVEIFCSFSRAKCDCSSARSEGCVASG